jgi:hypothetical protein
MELPERDRAVLTAFDLYRNAVTDRDGETAVAKASRRTLEYYELVRRAALFMKEEEVHKLDYMDRFFILMIRARLDAETLSYMDGAALFEHGVREGWTSQSATQLTDINRIRFSDDRAICTFSTTTGMNADMVLWLEDGEWKIDFAPVLKAISNHFEENVPDHEKQDELIFKLIREAVGHPVTADLWQPLVPPPGTGV